MKLPARDRLLFVALFVASIAITYARDPDLYRLPAAAYEDGREMFAFYYNHPEPSSILRSYNGYVSLVPNLAGYLAARLPTVWIPHALALFPLAVAALAFSLLALEENRPLIASDGLRAVGCLVLALAPLGKRMFVSSTMYSLWNLLFILVLISLWEPPRSRLGAVGRALLLTALIWSNPLSVALLPVYGLLLAAHWKDGSLARLYYSVLAAVTVLYQLVAVEHLRDKAVDLIAASRVTVIFVLERVVFNTLFSDRLSRVLRRQEAVERISWAAIAVVALLVAVLVAVLVLYRRRLSSRPGLGLTVLAYSIVAFTALYVVGRSADLEILARHAGHRYFWVQRLCFLVLLLVVVDLVLAAKPGRLGRAALTVMSLAVVYQLVWLNRVDNAKYRGRPGAGAKMRAFTAGVAAQEARGDGSVEARYARGVWSFELHRPPTGEARPASPGDGEER